MSYDAPGDGFLGYTLRKLEEKLEALSKNELLHFGEVKVRLTRLEQKVEALAQEMTPEERAALIAQINADAAKVSQSADAANVLAGKLDQTGVS